jgi:hypothetical protein
VKLMYALWSDNLAPLHSARLRERLAEAGVRELQLNLDDHDVRAARLRLCTTAEPIRAVVSAWTDAGPEPVTRALAESADRVAGWVVEETQPLPPPATSDGVRADALANVALLRIPPRLSPEEWRERWQRRHTQLAIDTQATFGYVQNLVVEPLGDEPLGDGAAGVAAIVEELFPLAAMTDLHAFYGSGGDEAELRRRMRRMAESTATFGASTNLDLVPTSRYVFRLRRAPTVM